MKLNQLRRTEIDLLSRGELMMLNIELNNGYIEHLGCE
jgi:hypothetical protein